jgi:AcrR family transcriptional regulator
MSRITQSTKTETRDCILKQAKELFTSLGYDKTTTKAIAKKCKIAEGTLFNYFANKDEILVTVFEQIVIDYEEDSNQVLPSAEQILIEASIRPVKKISVVSKAILIDIFIIMIKMAKKKKKIYQKFAEIDLAYMKDLERLLGVYLDLDNTTVDELDLSEIIYGVVASDFMLYLYDTESKYNDFEERVTRKLRFILKPYIRGESYADKND